MATLRWSFEPSILIGLAAFAGAYGLAVGPLRRRWRLGSTVPLARQLAFTLGTLCAFIALVSPLDELADHALFSAHMAQHVLLTFVAPPLWLIGMPAWLAARLVPAKARAVLANPLVAFTVFNAVMWLWHLPAAYDAALGNETLHIGEHLMFMGSALIGWWPVLGPDLTGQMRPAVKLGYLIPSLFSCTALAALITLSAVPLYPFYAQTTLAWGLTPLVDQQVGGLVMWMTGDLIDLILIVWVVKALFDQPQQVTG
ncbi:MAG TPA: cytochrome c oxidase assembly protein [Anaerolineaceae bacterium]|nr:cytochrome c oxidase assembly protein [Anaerolineaceae bacterium]